MSNLSQLTSSGNKSKVSNICQREPQVQQNPQVLAFQKVQEHVEQPLSGSSPPKQNKAIKKMPKEELKRHVKKKIPSKVKSSLQSFSGNQKLQSQLEIRQDKLKSKPEKNTQEMSFNRKFESFNKNFEGFLRQISKESIKCSICLEPMISPALKSCGHIFCQRCIDQSILKSYKCPSCHSQEGFSETIISPIINNIIKAKVKVSFEREQVFKFEKRQAEFQQWQKRRVIKDEKIYIGAVIDVRDRQDRWRKAEILEIYTKKKENQCSKVISALLVHFINHDQINDQIIEVISNRFASQFYTNNARQNTSNMSDFVLEGQ